MRTIGYARVSTREQAEDSHALENQIAALKAAGATEILHDVITGSKFDRQSFNVVMELVKTKQVEKVIFRELPRLGRNTLEILNAVEEFKKAGVALNVINQHIDTSSPWGTFQLTVLSGLAQVERDILIKRTQDGWQETRNAGRAVSPPYGYRNQDGKYILADKHTERDEKFDPKIHDDCLCLIESKQAYTRGDLAKDVIATFLETKGLSATLRAINTKYGIQRIGVKVKGGGQIRHGYHWSKSGLSSWLHNPVLQGHSAYLKAKEGKTQDKEKWDVKYDTHLDQALLTVEQYEEVKAILATNAISLRSSPSERKYATSGLICCAVCGFKMYTVNGKKMKNGFVHRYYQCKNFRDGACPNGKLIRVEKLQEAILKALVHRQFDIQDELDELDAEIASRPQEVEAKLTELRGQLVELSAMKPHPAIDQAKAAIENQIKILELRSEYKRVSKVETNKFLKSPEIKQAIEAGTLFDNANATTLHKLIKAVRVRDGEIEAVEFNGQDW